MTTLGRRGLSPSFVIGCNFSARRGEASRSSRPLEGFWALSRINIRECVQTRRVGGARWKAAGDTVREGKLRRRGTAEEGGNERRTEGEGEEGTRWEHVSHTEIVNYSFVPRRVGVIWKRDAACECRARPTEKENGVSKERKRGGGGGKTGRENIYTHRQAQHTRARVERREVA